MLNTSSVGRFSVYLGDGIYIGGIVHPEPELSNSVPVFGLPDGAALSLSRVGQAAMYARSSAVRVCHFARRHGLRAWIVQHPATAAA